MFVLHPFVLPQLILLGVNMSNRRTFLHRAFASGAATGLAVCRYRGAPIAATARLLSDERMVVHLEEPASIVTPGQLLVLYDAANSEVLASGIIEPDDATKLAAAS